ncbi:MAG: ketoacyl-ACP synthase III [Chloroflexi bacterium]|nr:ketoacyl-ACP synthase III [Chloroflexota bacterium]
MSNGTYAHITGWGMHVPEKILTNAEIAKMVDTDDEWIRDRTGIEERRIASEQDTCASLGAQAATNALRVAKLHPSEVDLIITATSSPEYLFPATACIIQDRIGAVKAGAFDISAACTGFIYAIEMAAQSIRGGSVKNALVIGTETLSRIVDWTDRETCILFGDGAGAFVLQASDFPGGVLSSMMRSDGSGAEALWVPAGGSAIPTSLQTVQEGLHFVKMNGREVYRFATRVMAQGAREVIEKANLDIDDIDLFIPHQANKRIIEAAARGLKVSMDRIVVNVQKYGNTSTASIPIATCEAIEEGRLKPGDTVVFVGFGGGLTWGAIASTWTGPLTTKPRRLRLARYRRIVSARSFLRRIWRRIDAFIWGRGKTSN